MKLYEITEAYLSLAAYDEANEMGEYLDSIRDEFDEKAKNIVYLIKDFETDMETLKTEEKRLAEKRKSLEGRRDYLKNYLYENMKAMDKPKLKAGTYDLNIRKNPKSVNIIDPTIIEGNYYKIKSEIDKQKIKADIEAGIAVAGAELVQGESLRIK